MLFTSSLSFISSLSSFLFGDVTTDEPMVIDVPLLPMLFFFFLFLFGSAIGRFFLYFCFIVGIASIIVM